ncbi:Hypp4332 [Branchiostoma lanceolatum]|uniref:Hypp4332 protein n=1 Tax=Branchiostoma lanceolatum TaxID=7740 RepID=A0A8K0A6W6_BRALA|nr:Hypp4332 [Branchiostoma lanceolatum]
MSFLPIPDTLPCIYPLGMEGKDLFSIPTNDLPCPSPVVKITQDIDDDLQFRCQATWEEDSSIFWILPDNATIPLPGLVCMALLNVYREEHVMAKLRSNNQPDNVPEDRTEEATDNTLKDPYYSTISDVEDEPVRPYGMAKAGTQYGRTKKRFRSVRENAITGPRPRSERCDCYNQTTGKDSVPGDGALQERDAS